MAEVLARIRRHPDADWRRGEGWASPPHAAIRLALEAEFGCKIPGTPTEGDNLKAGAGADNLIATKSVMKRIWRKIDDDEIMKPAYTAYCADKLDPQGRVFVMTDIRSWLYYALQKLSVTAQPASLDWSTATILRTLASHHGDREGLEQIEAYIDSWLKKAAATVTVDQALQLSVRQALKL